MPIMQMTRKPVTVYQSTDEQAPQLTVTPGSLKTLLEACLVTGYGSKQALGWEMPFSDAASAVFKSQSPDATGCYLHITHAQANYADVRGYHSMTALTAGTGMFAPNNITRLPLSNRQGDRPGWLLVGHDKAFWFFFEDVSVQGNTVIPLYFGDYPTLAVADRGNCALLNLCNSNSITYLGYSNFDTNWMINYGGQYRMVTAKSYDQLSANIGLRGVSRCAAYNGIPYPDVITGGLQMDAVDLLERVTAQNDRVLRGRLPGIYCCAHDLRSIKNFAVMDGFEDTTDSFVKTQWSSGNTANARDHYLINTTAWLA